MHLTAANFWNKWKRNGRWAARPVRRFTEVYPLKLRNSVSSSSKGFSDVVCMHQMMQMLNCFKANDYDQTPCDKEMTEFRKCYSSYLESVGEMKSKLMSTEPVPGLVKLPKEQLNNLLKRYSQPK